jgi:aldose 1-epimerase
LLRLLACRAPIMSLLLIYNQLVAAAAPAPPPSFWNCTTLPSDAFKPIHLTNAQRSLSATMIPYGATVTHLFVKDRSATNRDVILGWDDPTQYCSNPQHTYFGATIGRVANRVANCSFSLDSVTYALSCNEKDFDTLHGGLVGWDRRVWTALEQTSSSVTWHYHSPAGEMGFPGAVTVNVTHTITDDGEWSILYSATSDAHTVLAMTNHAYFNLNANLHNTPTVLEHTLSMPTATRVLEVSGPPDYHLIPSGRIENVAPGSAKDFAYETKALGRDIDHGDVTPRGGYDNAWIFDAVGDVWRHGGPTRRVATLFSPLTGISLEMHTDQPSVQVYTGNFLNGTDPALRIRRKASQSFGPEPQYYQWRGAVTLEAQMFPDAVHHTNFPSIELKPGGRYVQRTSYVFNGGATSARR